MADIDEKPTKKEGMNPIVTGVAGAAIGAGVAVAASTVLSNKKTRDQVFHTIAKVKDQAKDSINTVWDKAMEMKDTAKKH